MSIYSFYRGDSLCQFPIEPDKIFYLRSYYVHYRMFNSILCLPTSFDNQKCLEIQINVSSVEQNFP
jgi:hypothetical protein